MAHKAIVARRPLPLRRVPVPDAVCCVPGQVELENLGVPHAYALCDRQQDTHKAIVARRPLPLRRVPVYMFGSVSGRGHCSRHMSRIEKHFTSSNKILNSEDIGILTDSVVLENEVYLYMRVLYIFNYSIMYYIQL